MKTKKEELKQNLEKLKFIKNATNRSIEFWCPSYIDTQNTKFEDNAFKKEEIIDTAINAAILYLENKLKEMEDGRGNSQNKTIQKT